jgi:hypothetical protein
MKGQVMTSNQNHPFTTSSAWVVFSDQSPKWWLRLLKPGFRHCFIVRPNGPTWQILDPYTQPPKMVTLPFPASFNLPHWLEGQGFTVLATTTSIASPPPSYLACSLSRLMGCRIGMVKRSLGLPLWRALTPWQLYRLLLQPSVLSNPALNAA